MTQLELARKGVITPQIRQVAADENIDPELLCARVAEGVVVIPANKNHQHLIPKGIGKGLTIKVNANIGTSRERSDIKEELVKLKMAVEAGADAIMDLSTGGDLTAIRKGVLKETALPFGTVPIYQAAIEAVAVKNGIVHMTPDGLFNTIRAQAEEGVDFMTVHCGVTRFALERLKKEGRITNIVSRGGAFLASWMIYNDKENPLYEGFDQILDIAREYDVTLSLGDGLRPGCLADATDRAQIQELIILGELTQRAWDAGVQVMVEGPGHVPLNEIETNIVLQKSLCKGAPFYVLGPLVTDIAAGYDHIACAIGGALAGMAGADFLCYVTPAEHLKLPCPEDVREGVIAAKIAAHAADIARGHSGAISRDRAMAEARRRLDWKTQIELAIDPVRARTVREQDMPSIDEVCTMCGEFCAIKMVRDFFER
ncbi:MAG: phosphomethylpyrimidine synthase ThiC [Pseudomonadota bacterium]